MFVSTLKKQIKGNYPCYVFMSLNTTDTVIGGNYVVAQKSSLTEALKALPDTCDIDVWVKPDGVYIGGPRPKKSDADA